MISYLILSALSMGVLLLFYHVVLEQEKIHHFNRGFLIFALVFSLVIPVLPVGLFQIPLQWTAGESLITNEAPSIHSLPAEYQYPDEAVSGIENRTAFTFSDLLFWFALPAYLIVTVLLFIRFLRIINRLQLKAKRYRVVPYKGTPVVLHNETVVPYSFLKTIYVNRYQFRNGEITADVLRHELAHTRQLHSLDILFVELLKIAMWFNPVLYLYKKAMLLNHEFLADQFVLAGGTGIASYQRILFNSLRLQTPHGLSSNFSYSITKKRFAMMTKTRSRFRSILKMILPAPLILLLALVLGCESTSPGIANEAPPQDEVTLQITGDNFLRLDGNEYDYAEFEEYFSTLAEPPELVHFEVSTDASMGLITDVQKVLRKKGALKINYKSIRPDSGSEPLGKYDRLTNELMDATKGYMELPPDDVNKLEDAYSDITQILDSMVINLKELPDAPPPPPIPPSPAKRIINDLNEAEELQSPEPPPVRLRNLMRIKIDSDGTVFMNNEPETINNINTRITEFLENPSDDPELPVSPQEAVIAINTESNTPYTRYTETLDQVMQAYHVLRDNTSIEEFGTPYTALTKDSAQKQEIDSAVPIRISIAEYEVD